MNEFGADIKVTDNMRAWFAYQGYPLSKDTTEIKIPERSFVRTSFDKYKSQIDLFVQQELDSLMDLKINVSQFYTRVGEYCVGKLKEYITDLKDPANSSLTVEMKGSSNPLIDNAGMRNAVEWRVV